MPSARDIKAGAAYVELTLRDGALSRGLRRAQRRLQAFSGMVGDIGRRLTRLSALMSAPFIAGVGVYAAFEQQLANVATMLERPEEHLPRFRDEIRQMAAEFGESTEALAGGLYDILSASVPAEEALSVLAVAARAAKAGLTDTATAADAITTVLNAYGLQGLITCAHCGCGMTYTWTKKRAGKGGGERLFGYYSCHKARERGAERCPMPSLPSETVEDMVVKEIAAICGDPALTDNVITQVVAEQREARDRARDHLAKAEAERDTLAKRDQKQSTPVTRNALKQAEGIAAAAAEVLAAIDGQPVTTGSARQALRRFDGVWAELNHDERRQLLRSLISGVHIDGERGTMRIDFASQGIAALAGS